MAEYALNLATNLFIIYNVYMILNYLKIIFFKKSRSEHREKRSRMNELRQKPVKTLEEQKEFVDLKRPKSEPFKWTFKNVKDVVFKIVFFVGIIIGVRFLWIEYIMFNFALWHIIIYAFLFPIIINMILRKYGLEQDDMLIFFK